MEKVKNEQLLPRLSRSQDKHALMPWDAILGMMEDFRNDGRGASPSREPFPVGAPARPDAVTIFNPIWSWVTQAGLASGGNEPLG